MCEGARPFIPVPGVFKVTLVYSLFAQKMMNVFNVRSGGGVLTADADRIEAVFANWWTTSMRTQVTTSLSLVTIVLDALNAEASLHKEYTSGWTAPGLMGGTPFPGGTTTSVKLATGIRGRSYRGRIYWPGLTINQVTNGLVTTTARDAIAVSANLLRTSLAADVASDKLVVVSYCQDGSWLTEGVATEITSASAHLLVDSQRRRLIGRGL